MQHSQLAVVILAAGQGTRMKSSLPKVLHPLAGTPLIGHVVAAARSVQPRNIVAVLRHQRDEVAAVLNQIAPEVLIADQDDVPGTGRALEVALELLEQQDPEFAGQILVLSGDVPLLSERQLSALIEHHVSSRNQLTLLSAVVDDAQGLGRILRSEEGDFVGIVEHKDATVAERAIRETNAGVYLFECASVRKALTNVQTNNTQNEKYLTDAAAYIASSGGAIAAVAVNDNWLVAGVNDRVQLAALEAELNRRVVERWQRDGVTVQDPHTTWIEPTVQLAQDVTLLPGTHLRGATTVGTGTVIGPDTTITDCAIGEHALIRRSDASGSRIGDFADVGPFSYLRPGTELGASGKIGAYVETKNARIGAGSKVPHLSYVGDASIGTHSNVGAGTIFANYDGQTKHHSAVGDRVRIGSKNVLVAPVTIADGAYTGAGAVIRKDVPADSLALSVAPQRNIDGWVTKNRPNQTPANPAEKHGE